MIFAALMFVFGAWCVQQLTQLPSVLWLLSACLASVLLFFLQLNPRFIVVSANFHNLLGFYNVLRTLLLGISTMLFGVCWASAFAILRMQDALPYAWEQTPITIIGVVAGMPEVTARGERFKFDVEQVLTKEAVVPKHISLNQYRDDSFVGVEYAVARNASQVTSKVTRKVSAKTPINSTQQNQFYAGERWQLTVSLKRPHGTQNPHGFDFESWALSENIRATGSVKNSRKNAIENKRLSQFVWQPQYVIERVREHVKQRIAGVLFQQPYSGIIQALVIGDDSQINQDDWQVFLRTGTSHLMSISGLHITMLSGLAFAITAFLWRRQAKLVMRLPTRKAATLVGVIAALSYALIAGFSVPSQRTFYMLMVFAVALWSGRQLVISQVLAAALFIVVLLDPWAVSSPGFWLSFTAVAMLAYALGARIGQTHWLMAAVQTQWAVTIGMLPLLLVMFNQASIISPIANAFAIPLISFIVTPLALLGSFLPIDFPLDLAYQALKLCMVVLHWFNQLPIATWRQHAPELWTLFPAMLGMLWLLLPRGFPLRWLGLVCILPMLFIAPERPQPGDMKVTVLDVGQGLSVVVQTAKHTLLYDAGPKYNAQSDAGSRIVLPFLIGEGVKKIDGFFVSHNDNDHSGGMNSVLALMPVTWLASSLPESVAIINTKKMHCYAGQQWVWDGVRFEVLHPQLADYENVTIKDNNLSCVLKVISLSGSILLTGDIEKNVEMALLSQLPEKLKSDVIVAPHHGSKSSSSADFVAAVAPSVSIFTAGYLNRFKHPAPVTIAHYQAVNSMMYRSDYHGALVLSFNSRLSKEHEIQVVDWRHQAKRYWHDDYDSASF